MTIRPHGKAGFAHLAGGGKRLQIYVRLDAVGERDFELYKLLDIGDLMGVAGYLFRTRTGELTIHAERLQFLAKALLPLPEKWHGLTDVEIRYRQRYLDLMVNEESERSLSAAASWYVLFGSSWRREGYVEVETPMMQPLAGGAMARPFVTHHNALDIEPLPAHRPRALLEAANRGGSRPRVRNQPELPQRRDLHAPQPGVHDAGVLSGLRRLPGYDGVNREDAAACGAERPGDGRIRLRRASHFVRRIPAVDHEGGIGQVLAQRRLGRGPRSRIWPNPKRSSSGLRSSTAGPGAIRTRATSLLELLNQPPRARRWPNSSSMWRRANSSSPPSSWTIRWRCRRFPSRSRTTPISWSALSFTSPAWRWPTPSVSSMIPPSNATASSISNSCARRATCPHTPSTRTTSALSATACRPPAGRASASTASQCCLPTRAPSATLFFSRSYARRSTASRMERRPAGSQDAQPKARGGTSVEGPTNLMSRTRREFLGILGGAAAWPWVGGSGLAYPVRSTPAAQAPGGRKIGYGIVGLGRISMGQFMPGVRISQRSKVVALVSGHRDKAERVASQYGVSSRAIYSYENYDEIAHNPEIDALYIALPNGMHAEYTIRGAQAGKHVLCEKPMANSVLECEQMIAACRKAKRKLMIAYRCRLEPTNRRAIEHPQTGLRGHGPDHSQRFRIQYQTRRMAAQQENGGGRPHGGCGDSTPFRPAATCLARNRWR